MSDAEDHPSYIIPILAIVMAFTASVVLTVLCILFG